MRVVTFGSGKGGTGRSVLVANLGLVLARRGVRTCLVDLDFDSADLHLLLGKLHPGEGIPGFLRGRSRSLAELAEPVESIPNLDLVAGPGETLRPTGLRWREIRALADGILGLPHDVVLVDLPAGAAHQVLDLFLAGDLQVAVANPDPVSLADAARFLRLARVRRVVHGTIRTGGREPRVYTSLDDLVRDMTTMRRAAAIEQDPAGGFHPALVLNRTRPGADPATGELVEGLGEEIGEGIELLHLGDVPEDPAVDRSVRLLAPLVQLAPRSPASRAIRDVAREIAPGDRWEAAEGAPAEQPGREPVPV